MTLDRTKEKTRRHRGKAFWRRMVVEQRNSDLSQLEFCQRNGFARSTFHRWARRFRDSVAECEEMPPAPEFVAVKVRREPSLSDACDHFELLFPDGLRLKIPDRFESGTLVEVLNAVEAAGRC